MNETLGEGERFTDAEVASFLRNAFTAAVHPALGSITEERLGYLRGYAVEFLKHVEALDVTTGHLTWDEVVALLTGAALAARLLHRTEGS